MPVRTALAMTRRDGAGPRWEVRASLERALELEPASIRALVALAELSAAQGDREAALSLYDEATKANPGDPAPAWAAIELLGAGTDGTEIDRRLQALLAAHGYHSGAAMLRARRMLEAGGPLEQAQALVHRALLFQGGPEARALLGNIELERGDTAAAAAHLRAALDMGAFPGDAEARTTLERLDL